MDLKYTNIFRHKAHQNIPKLGFLVCKIYHLATLAQCRNMYLAGAAKCTKNTQILKAGNLPMRCTYIKCLQSQSKLLPSYFFKHTQLQCILSYKQQHCNE
jgi:hypothetical protein